MTLPFLPRIQKLLSAPDAQTRDLVSCQGHKGFSASRPVPSRRPQLPAAPPLEQTSPSEELLGPGRFPSSLLVIRGESCSVGHWRPIWPLALAFPLENLAEAVWGRDQPLSGKGT